MLVPIFTMLGGFTEHEAIPLSIATICGGSAFSVLFNFLWMAHPLRPHRHVIAYDSAVILMPMTLAGVSVGVYLNKVCPNWLIMSLLVLLCGYTGRRTLHQGIRAYGKESVNIANRKAMDAVRLNQNKRSMSSAGEDSESGEVTPMLASCNALKGSSSPGCSSTHEDAPPKLSLDERTARRATMLSPGITRPKRAPGADAGTKTSTHGGSSGERESRHSGDLRDYDEAPSVDLRSSELHSVYAEETKPPWGYLLMLAKMWTVVVLLALLKGGHGMPSVLGLECGSASYWAAVLMAIPALLLLSREAADVVVDNHHRLVTLGYEYAEGDVIWNQERVRHSCTIVGIAAVAAGLLGVGGGMVLGPIFIELQLNPLVAQATSTFMVLIMASCTIMQFIIFGMLDQSFASWYGMVGILGAIVGTKGAKVLVEKSGRTSLLIFVLAALLFLSGTLMLAVGSVQLWRSGLTGFRSLCGRAGAAAAND